MIRNLLSEGRQFMTGLYGLPWKKPPSLPQRISPLPPRSVGSERGKRKNPRLPVREQRGSASPIAPTPSTSTKKRGLSIGVQISYDRFQAPGRASSRPPRAENRDYL